MEPKTPEVQISPRKEHTNKHKQFKFSGVKACDKCGSFFLSVDLMTEHQKKYHVESVEIEIDDYTSRTTVSPTKRQIHCGLEEEPQCVFQCENKDELNKHIENTHRRKNQIQCTACSLYFRDIDDLAKHMSSTHKRTEVSILKCNQCQNNFGSDTELKKHLNNDHTSYKPCIRFAADKCNTVECRFNHIKLQQNQEICYKCGDKFDSKTVLLNHIKAKHGKEVCHRFLKNECEHSSENCIFSHKSPQQSVQNYASPQFQQQDFTQLPT